VSKYVSIYILVSLILVGEYVHMHAPVKSLISAWVSMYVGMHLSNHCAYVFVGLLFVGEL
jgi:hypothetical protein